MRKRGISPLIAWILIIGFSISLAAFVITWAINQTRDIKLDDQTIQEYCENVGIRIDNICVTSDDKINATISNQGYFNITIATFTRETQMIPKSSCIELNLQDGRITSPGSTFNYIHPVNGTFIFNQSAEGIGQLTECQQLIPNGISDPYNVTYFAMIPWIKIKDTYVPCQNKKREVDEVLLDCP